MDFVRGQDAVARKFKGRSKVPGDLRVFYESGIVCDLGKKLISSSSQLLTGLNSDVSIM